jgi:hypothetical protein
LRVSDRINAWSFRLNRVLARLNGKLFIYRRTLRDMSGESEKVFEQGRTAYRNKIDQNPYRDPVKRAEWWMGWECEFLDNADLETLQRLKREEGL